MNSVIRIEADGKFSVGKNDSYLASVAAGFRSPLLMLTNLLRFSVPAWYNVVKALGDAILCTLVTFVLHLVVWPAAGLFGFLRFEKRVKNQ